MVIKEYLNGKSRDKIAQIAGISPGKTSNIIKDWKNQIDIPNIEEVRDFSVLVKKAGLSIGQCAQGYRMFQMMKNLGITDNNENDENKIDDLEFTKDLNSNNKIKYNEFSSFVHSIFLNCKNHGIEPNDVFSWIIDMHNYFIPMISTLSHSTESFDHLSDNNTKNSLAYSDQKQENPLISKKVPIITQISFFIDQKKKECTQLEYYKKKLEKEINESIIERDNLTIENDDLTENNKKIIQYLDWYYTLKTELSERYSIGIDDFEKFANLITNFRNLGLNIPKIIEKFVTAITIEEKIQEERQHLERLQKENTQLYNSLLNWQEEINKYKQSLDTYQKLNSMGFGLKEIKQLRHTILEIAVANNIPDDKAILKFLKDLEEQYDNKLGFEIKIDEKIKELNKINDQIINLQHILKVTPFIGPAISNLFQKGVFEQSIIAVSQLVDENINHEFICQDNSNNNASIKKKISKAEQLEQLIKDIRNYKNIKIEIKEKQVEFDSLQEKVNDLYNQKQQVEKLLQNFKSMINSMNDKISYHKINAAHVDISNTINLSSTSYPSISINRNLKSDLNMDEK